MKEEEEEEKKLDETNNSQQVEDMLSSFDPATTIFDNNSLGWLDVISEFVHANEQCEQFNQAIILNDNSYQHNILNPNMQNNTTIEDFLTLFYNQNSLKNTTTQLYNDAIESI